MARMSLRRNSVRCMVWPAFGRNLGPTHHILPLGSQYFWVEHRLGAMLLPVTIGSIFFCCTLFSALLLGEGAGRRLNILGGAGWRLRYLPPSGGSGGQSVAWISNSRTRSQECFISVPRWFIWDLTETEKGGNLCHVIRTVFAGADVKNRHRQPVGASPVDFCGNEGGCPGSGTRCRCCHFSARELGPDC